MKTIVDTGPLIACFCERDEHHAWNVATLENRPQPFFAYLKELCLSATMAWMNAGGKVPMDEVVAAQTTVLATQMRSPGAGSDGDAAEQQLTPRDRFQRLIRGEAP